MSEVPGPPEGAPVSMRPMLRLFLLIGFDLPPWLIVVMINLLLMVLGMFMDPMSVLVIMVPIFFPAIIDMGYDPVWFGIVVTINIEIAAISPPVGFNLFVLQGLTGRNILEIARAAIPFFVLLQVAVVLLVIFPEIATFLPQQMTRG